MFNPPTLLSLSLFHGARHLLIHPYPDPLSLHDPLSARHHPGLDLTADFVVDP